MLEYNFPSLILLYFVIKDDNNFKLIRAEEAKGSLRMHELYKGSVSPFFKQLIYCVGFEVLTAVVAKSSVFWYIMPFSLLEVHQRFGGTCHLHFQS
jgi:hypothetical protein